MAKMALSFQTKKTYQRDIVDKTKFCTTQRAFGTIICNWQLLMRSPNQSVNKTAKTNSKNKYE
jgi:hypothetical protein